jgi:hypothetical protein
VLHVEVFVQSREIIIITSSHHHLVAIKRSYETSKINEIRQTSCESSLNKLAKNATLLENTLLDERNKYPHTNGP